MPHRSKSRGHESVSGSFQLAEKLLSSGDDDRARRIYSTLVEVPSIASVACFRLGEIYNRGNRPKVSYDYHSRALELDPRLASHITAAEHVHHDYIYREVREVDVRCCPLCGNEGQAYWAFNMLTNGDFNQGFNPVRLWMYCNGCHHIFANNYPADLKDVLTGSSNEQYSSPRTNLFPFLGKVISEIKPRSPGNKLLDVGIGGGEMLAVAKEYGFNVYGLEIRPLQAKKVSEMLDIDVYCEDFNEFETAGVFDVICMGDVIEHMPDPLGALEKARTLLGRNGIVWISTPNFESAFSLIAKDSDPMRRVCEHLNYFSYRSLEKSLSECGFEVVDYQISAHYNGSMEITAVRT